MRIVRDFVVDDLRRVRFSVLVRGNPLQIHKFKDTGYIEGTPDSSFAVRLENRCDQPLNIALSIDGCDLYQVQHRDLQQTEPLCINPNQVLEIDSWHSHELLKFVDPRDDGAIARISAGRRRNVGVIGVTILELVPAFAGYRASVPVSLVSNKPNHDILAVHYRTSEWLEYRGIIDKLPNPFPQS